MRCVDALPQLLQCVGCDDIAATPSDNVDNTILTYCTESYTHSYVICSANALVNRPGGVGTYMSAFILLLSVVVLPSRASRTLDRGRNE